MSIDTGGHPAQRRRELPPAAAIAAVLLAAAIICLIVFFYRGRSLRPRAGGDVGADARRPPAAGVIGARVARSPARPAPPADSHPREKKIPDDGRTMWASPTAGAPLTLKYLPVGSQIFIALRPADIAGHRQGEKVIAALGPAGAAGRRWLTRISGFDLAAIQMLLVGLQINLEGRVDH